MATMYDRIKEMSIDEMAELFSKDYCEQAEMKCTDSLCGDDNCIKHLKQWLESEVEE